MTCEKCFVDTICGSGLYWKVKPVGPHHDSKPMKGPVSWKTIKTTSSSSRPKVAAAHSCGAVRLQVAAPTVPMAATIISAIAAHRSTQRQPFPSLRNTWEHERLKSPDPVTTCGVSP